MRLKSSHSPFEALLEAIIYQQLNGRAAATILSRLLGIFGDFHPTPEMIIATQDELFRAAGVSRGKTLALRDLAAKTLDGTVPTLAKIRRMSDEDIIEHLTQVRGIGPWTVEMLLIFQAGAARHTAGERLWSAQGLCADVCAHREEQAVYQ